MEIEEAIQERQSNQRPMLKYAPGYAMYVDQDEETSDWFILFCQGEMPPHDTRRFKHILTMYAYLEDEGWTEGWELIEVDA